MQKGLDERDLVSEVLSGNKKAFIKLIKQYEGLVLHIVTPLIGINEDREDICQDVFIKVYEKLRTFQFNSKLSTWIGNIAYNTSINYLQKKKNILLGNLTSVENEFYPIESGNIEMDNPEKMFIRHEDMEQLNKSVNMLTELQKTIILLFYQDEMSLDEIGIVMEMPLNTVKSHLFRAKKSLKEIMNKIGTT
jgi:RNA polymerase sigma factor (sigma-70 family)